MNPTLLVSHIHRQKKIQRRVQRERWFKSPFSMVSTQCWQFSLIFLQNIVKVILNHWPVINHQLPSEGCSDEKLLLFSLQRSWCPHCSHKWISTLHTRLVTMLQSYRIMWISSPEASKPLLEWPEPVGPEGNAGTLHRTFVEHGFLAWILFWSSIARCHLKQRNKSPQILVVINYDNPEYLECLCKYCLEKSSWTLLSLRPD